MDDWFQWNDNAGIEGIWNRPIRCKHPITKSNFDESETIGRIKPPVSFRKPPRWVDNVVTKTSQYHVINAIALLSTEISRYVGVMSCWIAPRLRLWMSGRTPKAKITAFPGMQIKSARPLVCHQCQVDCSKLLRSNSQLWAPTTFDDRSTIHRTGNGACVFCCLCLQCWRMEWLLLRRWMDVGRAVLI